MLSILIPIYNIAIGQLVADLSSQAQTANIPFEIICLDDASDKSIQLSNQSIQSHPSVFYEILASNVGRSRIRNILARKAQFPNLLFLDCDAKIIRPDFVQKYLYHIHTSQVIVGGRMYPQKPNDQLKHLHWKFGSLREQGNESAFQSNNFLIPKSLMSRFPFDETITTYGHEDTLLGHELNQHRITITYINNPVLHNDLIAVEDFLDKQQDALLNLIQVRDRFPDISTRFTRTMKDLDFWYVSNLLRPYSRRLKAFCHKQLLGGSTFLPFLDLFKICTYLELIDKHKRDRSKGKNLH